jgi:coenzyme F420-0:L-glutamate ligase/coenzyme F420-1:gamma-L-glutamate ligase
MPVEAEQINAFIASRRSIRRFTSEAIPRGTIERLIASGCRAPSAHNRQPWRYAVLVDSQRKAELAQALGARLRADRLADGDDLAAVEADVKRSLTRITGAQVVVVFCLTMEEMDTYPDVARSRSEFLMAVQSVAMAGYGFMLAAHAEGLGTCWMCAPLFAPEVVRETLGIPATWEPQGMIILGHPAESGRERDRKAAEEVSLFL